MNFCKLQIGCLFFSLYVIVLYIRQACKNKIPCHKLYDALMFVCPWAIIFDGLTAITVNCPDLVPDNTDKLLHAIFFVLMNTEVFLAYLYMLDITRGLPKKLFLRVINIIPFAGFNDPVLARLFLEARDEITEYYQNNYYEAGQ